MRSVLAREGNMETRLGGAVAAHEEWSGLVVCSSSVDGGSIFLLLTYSKVLRKRSIVSLHSD